MRLTCPCCGGVASMEAWLADRAARDAVAAALQLPAPLGGLLLRYIGLFRPRQHALSWERAARLLTELQTALQTAQIERNGRAYPAPVDYWKSALEQMLDHRDTLKLPLKTHGYLFEIIVGISQKAEDQRATRQEIEDERARTREGDRSGQMVQAASLVDHPNPAITAPASAQIDSQTGEILTEQRPARTPPPPEFKALLNKLRRGMPLQSDESPVLPGESP